MNNKMKIIIPMAGIGKRMRPHTLTVPKPLIRIAGKPIVQRLIEEIVKVCQETVDEIDFVISDFGKDVENQLITIAKNVGAKGKIYYQNEPLGTAHAILCAEKSLYGKTIIAFADTLFKTNFTLDQSKEAIIWTSKVKDPSAFGVVKIDSNNIITDFIEKPLQPVDTNLAIIGIYYFKKGEYLKDELKYLIAHKIQKNGEYQITDALQNMMEKGTSFYTNSIEEWLDCGNKDATVHANKRILEFNKNENLVSLSAKIHNSIIIKPCFIGDNVYIKNSIIGPYVSVGENSCIEKSVINNSIIQMETKVSFVNIENSMIGNHVELTGKQNDVSIGDYTILK